MKSEKGKNVVRNDKSTTTNRNSNLRISIVILAYYLFSITGNKCRLSWRNLPARREGRWESFIRKSLYSVHVRFINIMSEANGQIARAYFENHRNQPWRVECHRGSTPAITDSLNWKKKTFILFCSFIFFYFYKYICF